MKTLLHLTKIHSLLELQLNGMACKMFQIGNFKIKQTQSEQGKKGKRNGNN